MDLFENIRHIYGQGFRQKGGSDCGPASVVIVGQAYGLKRVTYRSLLSENYGRWLNRQAGRVRGIILTELHFAAEATFGSDFEVRLTRAFPENKREFLADLRRAKKSELAIILNFNQDFIMERPYKNDETAFTHYSPVAGFEGKHLTIADLDPQIEFPYTVKAEDAFESMAEPHHIFGYPRGWLTIRKRQ